MAAGDVQAAAEQFRYRLEQRDKSASARLVEMYRPAYTQLGKDADRLAQRIAEARAAGEDVNPAWLFQEQRYAELKSQMGRALKVYGKDAGDYIGGSMAQYVTDAVSDTKRLARFQGLRGTWADLNTDAITSLIGASSGYSSPLRRLFRDLGEGMDEALTSTLVQGLALGENPKDVARRIRDVGQIPLNRARTIARTEQLRAYRDATRQSYMKNQHLLEGWTWFSALGPRTCPACWAMHGTRHPVTEHMASHVNCRCTMIPAVQGGDLYIQPGADLFRALDPADQEAILGPGMFKAYKAGEVQLTDMVHVHRSTVWGDSVGTASIANAKNVAATGGQPHYFNYPPKPAVRRDVMAGVAADTSTAAGRIAAIRAAAAELRATMVAGEYDQAALDAISLGEKVNAHLMKNRAWKAAVEAQQELDTVRAELKRVNQELSRLPLGTAYYNARQAQKALADRFLELQGRVAQDKAAAFQAGFKQIRPLGGNLKDAQSIGAKDTNLAGVRTRVKEAAAYLPKDWVEDSNDLARRGLRYEYDGGGRAHYAAPTIKLGTVGENVDARSTALHELTHRMEDVRSGLGETGVRFREYRTQGETSVKLNSLPGHSGYRPDERTKLDKFSDPYMGKPYGDKYSEILTMGMESVVYGEETLDEEYLNFMLGLLAGG